MAVPQHGGQECIHNLYQKALVAFSTDFIERWWQLINLKMTKSISFIFLMNK